MRFDDRLSTILSAENATRFGATTTWRQLIDLVGRGEAAADEQILGKLRELRLIVPADVKAASARALRFASPPAALIAVIADDAPEVFAPVPGRFGFTDFGLSEASPASDQGEMARALPAAKALRSAEEPQTEVIAPPTNSAELDGFQRRRTEASPVDPAAPARDFHFRTDAAGAIRWVEGVSRPALVGVSLTYAGGQGMVRIDAGIASAVRSRARFTVLRMEVEGTSDAAGSWRITGAPRFDRVTGRFTGFQGVARRPFRHEVADTSTDADAADSLRQLVHELRTPLGAIAGFAELIGGELFGPVPDPYRARAAGIGRNAGSLLDAIEDLEVAARLESDALDLQRGEVALRPLVERVAADLQPLAAMRGVELVVQLGDDAVTADERGAERVIGRLFATLVAAAGRGEIVGVVSRPEFGQVALAFDRPRSLADTAGDDRFTFDGGAGSDEERSAPLLGVAFTLRLVRKLATELGGSLAIGRDRLTLRLPAAPVRRADLA